MMDKPSVSQARQTRSRTVLRWLFVAAFVVALAASGLFAGLEHGAGLIFVVLGSVAAAAMGFSPGEIGAALKWAVGGTKNARAGSASAAREERRRAAYFWEAAARNAWLLGALGSALNFTIALSGESGGIQAISNRMIQSFIVTLYGLVLGVVCLVPAMKLAGNGEGKAAEAEKDEGRAKAGGNGGAAGGRGAAENGGAAPRRADLFERAAGYVLFAAVLGLTIFFVVGDRDMQTGPLSLGKVLLYWPAILVVVGGAIALALFTGAGAAGRALTIGFGMTGFIALLVGLIQALFGFVHRDVAEISAGIAFIISGCAYAMLGLAVVAAPLEDREVAAGRRDRPGPFSRMIWIVFPILVDIFLLLSFIMVVTPMTKKG